MQIRINDILDTITEIDPDAETDLVERAYVFSARVHAGQLRLSGEPYLSHPLAVAHILAQMRLDNVSVAAGLLHDVVEDTHTDIQTIRKMFGPEVEHIVSGVTKISSLPLGKSQLDRQAENIRKMILAMADDLRVILIKLADRLHNMRTIGFHRPEKRRRIAGETLDIYAPLASRLGIYWIKRELEDASFQHLHPGTYEKIRTLVDMDRTEREDFISFVKSRIHEEMTKAGLSCEVLGRYKHFYSIYQKMLSQNLDFKDVYDIMAFRILLDEKPQCYEALGHLHNLWKPIDAKFKDYIGRPKPNMYQSLHTTVIGPEGERIEIQIRTREMDRVAKSGVAAHWSYKEGKCADEQICQQFAWIQDLVETQESIRDPKEFMESVRIDLYTDEVYVFTPKGEIKTLPKDSTPVDFAYAIHTEVGNESTGAKVNGRWVPLKHKLSTGDVVEVTTTKGHHPSKDWLNFVKTSKARSRIRQWIKNQEKKRSISIGRELCEKAFRKYKLNYHDLTKTDEMEEIVVHFGFKSLEDLVAAVGYGKITPLQIVRKFTSKEESAGEEAIVKQAPAPRAKRGVLIEGYDDILVRFGKCCGPVPGDPITGYITRGYGVTVHRVGCVNAMKTSSERQIDVEWSQPDGEVYPVRIQIISRDRKGLLADLAANISKNDANIVQVNSVVRENQLVDSYFTIMVHNLEQLNRLVSDLKRVNFIMDVKRIDS